MAVNIGNSGKGGLAAAAAKKLAGEGTTMVQHAEGDSNIIHEPVDWTPKELPQGVAHGELEWGAGITIPTVPYASVRLDCRIRLPFIPGDEDAAFAYALAWVDTRLTARVDEVKKAYNLD